MIRATFKGGRKFRSIIPSKKQYSIRLASSKMAELEKFAEENNLTANIVLTIFENNSVLFRESFSVGEGMSNNLLFLVSRTLDTTFKDSPQEEKDDLLRKLSNAMKEESVEQDYNKSLFSISNPFKKNSLTETEPPKRAAEEAELRRQEKAREEAAAEAEFRRQEKAREEAAEAERRRQEKAREEAAAEAELRRQEKAREEAAAEAELRRQEKAREAAAADAEFRRQEKAREAAAEEAELRRQEKAREEAAEAERRRQEKAREEAAAEAELRRQEKTREAAAVAEAERGQQEKAQEEAAAAERRPQENELAEEKPAVAIKGHLINGLSWCIVSLKKLKKSIPNTKKNNHRILAKEDSDLSSDYERELHMAKLEVFKAIKQEIADEKKAIKAEQQKEKRYKKALAKRRKRIAGPRLGSPKLIFIAIMLIIGVQIYFNVEAGNDPLTLPSWVHDLGDKVSDMLGSHKKI
ncbi:hypothetical protein [Bacillus velezensis]|uniref:hypothetical protein n=1 Tax=Bacillus velezensis TaxID=492670 RepID=UPI002E1E52B2|nr:hypothetical protein [Bacillus velezensis]